MANFTWTNAAGGDWSTASNWSLGGSVAPRPPEFGVDTAFFGDLANSYTVTVGTTVGSNILGAPPSSKSIPQRRRARRLISAAR
jgi:hypothetical protein